VKNYETTMRKVSEYNHNVRLSDMVAKCSDEKAILIAESIAAHRMAGLETWSLEVQLKDELTRMFAATRILNGKMPDKYNKLK